MKTGLETLILPAGEAGAEAAARTLAAGGLVAFPTETVYGLGADAANATAIAHLYAAKGRPAFNPLIAHVADLAAARRIGRFDACALSLAEAFWPGPLPGGWPLAGWSRSRPRLSTGSGRTPEMPARSPIFTPPRGGRPSIR